MGQTEIVHTGALDMLNFIKNKTLRFPFIEMLLIIIISAC